MATQGYLARIQVTSSGVALTDYTMADTGGGFVWRGSSSHRYMWDPSVAVVVKVNAVVEDPANYTFDYLLGLVTFTSDQTGNTVTVTGTRLYANTIATANGCTASMARTVLDTTVFQDTAVDRIVGLFDITGTISRLDFGQTDYDDDGSRSVEVFDLLTDGDYKAIEIRPDINSDEVIRAWVRIVSDEINVGVNDLQTAVLTFNGCIPDDAASDDVNRSFAWGDPIPST